MSKILERIEARKKLKESAMPADVTNQIASQYVADLEQKAYEKAQKELRHELMELANESEMEGYQKVLDATRAEAETAKMLLAQAQSEIAELKDLSKSLKIEVNNNSITLDELENSHASAMREQGKVIKQLENELERERSKPAPVPQPIIQQPEPIPSFEFIPIKGMDGRIQSVTAKPVYDKN
jgi:hypothetical protein